MTYLQGYAREAGLTPDALAIVDLMLEGLSYDDAVMQAQREAVTC